jgi:hypothetical protein
MTAHLADATIIDGAADGGCKAIRDGAANLSTPVDTSNAYSPEEIRRRQIWLAIGYITAMRARS